MANETRYLVVSVDGVELHIGSGKLTDHNSSNLIVAALKRSPTSTFRLDRAFVQKMLESIPVGKDVFQELANLVPSGLAVDINSALLIVSKRNGKTRLILGTSFGVALNLSALPLVGKVFSENNTVGVDQLQVVLSSALLDQTETTALRSLVPPNTVNLPQSINRGPNLLADTSFGSASGKKSLVLDLQSSSITTADTNTQQSTSSTSSTKTQSLVKPGFIQWFDVNRNFGPVTIKRIGGRYHDNALYFLLDAQMALGPLTVSLDGLSVGSPLDNFQPTFNLDGLGLDYSASEVAIRAAFLKDNTDNSFAGTAVISMPKFSLSAIGAYQEINGQPSIFIYAVLNLAVGVGPAFFQLEGVAAGFGYNRSLKIPPVDRIKEFPLVSTAVAADPNAETDPLTVLGSIKRDIPGSSGDMFFALGIKFSSFKLIDAFALLILSLGSKNRLDLLGLAKLTIPVQKPNLPPTPILAQVELAIKASYDFDQGTLMVEGRLTPASFIFTPDCHLMGGFAFCSWFDGPHAGDFVFTMGGYHPRYDVPAHYPSVPRLGFHWQLSPNLSVKGEMYYALVPGALMAGGRLEAAFNMSHERSFNVKVAGIKVAGVRMKGEIEASFTISGDFLIAWEPFYYEADLSLSIGIRASFSGHVNVLGFSGGVRNDFNLSLGADLSIKGPEFSGVAKVNWNIVSFTIEFGAPLQKPPPATWSQFKDAFLPPNNAINSLTVASGLIRKLNNGTQVINPAELALSVDSVIPLTQLKKSNVADTSGKSFHVAPMDNDATISTSKLTVTILDTDDKNKDVSSKFDITPVKKSAPAALWGTASDTGLNSQNALLEDLLMGCQIKPKPFQRPNSTEDKLISDFSYDVEHRSNAYEWRGTLDLNGSATDELGNINSATVNNARDQLLQAAGVTAGNIQLSQISSNPQEAFLVKVQQVNAA